MIRHLFIPLTNIGFSQSQAVFTVFLFSALFHEWFFIMSLKMLTPWLFLSFLLQIPLSFIVTHLFPQLRKIAVLFIVLIGLSALDLLYYHDYVIKYGKVNS